MIRIFISDDEQEIRRIDRSQDMAFALFEICHNLKGETVADIKEEIAEIMDKHNLEIDELTG
jgi:hypothetical protein